MIKSLLAITIVAFTLAGCGGSSSSPSDGTNSGNNGDGGGGDGGGTTIGGQTGTFGDSATSGLDATTTVCPASVTSSFTGWARLSDNTYCAWKCPDGDINDDGDDFGFIQATGQTCRDTTAAIGAQITSAIFSPINGCPTSADCSPNFSRVFITAGTNVALANDTAYTCTPRLFNETNRRWQDDSALTGFSLTLNNDGSNSAVIDGNNTTWSFADGVLTLEGQRVLNNVAVGSGSFSSWNSNTSLIRCTTGS
ncbi:hypothetical protein AB833_13160 [Chromatiales bacterium (ex Bugula neritina AB1)]|nr:hypothetical protein AB833_13160 [Chromatiales bacterium (ex Bugula neritina AB1)]